MGKKLSYAWLYEPKYCPCCGKEFYPTPKWTYREGSKYWCSWSCFKTRSDGADKAPKRKYRYKRVEQLELDGDTVVAVYDTPADACLAVDGTPQGIYDACRLGKTYKKYLWRYLKEEKGGVVKDDNRGVEADICESTRRRD